MTTRTSASFRLRLAALACGCVLVQGHQQQVSARAEATRPPLLLLADKDYPPLSYVEDGEAKGLDVDLAKALAPVLGREVRITLMNWAAAQQEVLAGRADGLLSMSMTADRATLYHFTEATETHDFGVFVGKQNAQIAGVEDLTNRTIGVTPGGLPGAFLRARGFTQLVSISNYDEGFARLSDGTLDAVAADRWVAAYTLEQRHKPDIISAGLPFARLSGGIAIRKNDAALAAELDDALRVLRLSGALDAIQQRWRSQEMMFVSRGRMQRWLLFASVGLVVTLSGAFTLWGATIRRQVRARRLLAQALGSAHDCISITDTNDKILYVNDAFLRTYEYTEQELLGRYITVVRASGNDPAVASAILEATLRDGWRGTLLNQSKSGRVFPISLSTSQVRDARGRVIAAVGVARDITAEQVAENALRRTEAKYREVVENANDIIFTVDRDGFCLSMNRAGLEISGHDPAEPRGTNLRQLVVPEHADMVWQQLQRVLDGEDIPAFEVDVVTRTGARRTLELNAHAIPSEHGSTGAQGIARDVTARKELEVQLRQAQKMDAIGRLAGGIAHDFNNSLTVILGYAELVRSQLDGSHRAQAELEEIQHAATNAASLTRQLLIFSRKGVVQAGLVDLNQVVGRLTRVLKRIVGEHITFTVTRNSDPAPVKVEAGQIEQVILNLVVNARDAMPTGGSLTIATNVVSGGHAVLSPGAPAAEGPFVALTVSDTGLGMTPEVRAQIFTPFFTTKGPAAGTGLGLAIVHGIVQQAGGHITVETAPGRGTTFTILLPLTPEGQSLSQIGDATTAATPVAGTILFVEDDESIRALGARCLRQRGYVVLTARHAADAMQVVEGHPGHIDLLLTDVVMPGLPGPALAVRLQEARPSLRVLYTSGYSEELRAMHKAPLAGGAFLPKPYTPDSLAQAVRSVLAR